MKTQTETNVLFPELEIPRKTRNKWISNISLKAVKEQRIAYKPIYNKIDLNSICTPIFKESAVEMIVLIGCDNGNRPTTLRTWEGTTNQCALYPAEVFKTLFFACCSSFFIAHNHPGGSCRPSEADWAITHRLTRIGKELDIPIMDHCIFAEQENGDFVIESLRQNSRWIN